MYHGCCKQYFYKIRSLLLQSLLCNICLLRGGWKDLVALEYVFVVTSNQMQKNTHHQEIHNLVVQARLHKTV